MIKIDRKELCCGCQACVQACPKQCINFCQDDRGFYYPEVDIAECVNCRICEKICPILNVKEYELPHNTLTYAAYNDNEQKRLSSSSGGIFTALAEHVISKNGIVFGAAFNEDFNVFHCGVENRSDLEKLKGSKYVQSYIGNCYTEVKSQLKDGRMVLFSGVPCQIAGLKHFLQKDYPNLILVDVVCHGVPSPTVWSKYLCEKKSRIAQENGVSKEKVAISNISFRDKRNSWRKFNLTIDYEILSENPNKEKEIIKSGIVTNCIWDDDYMLSFLKNYALRPSCFKCHFRNGKSRSDVTIADFWGVENCVTDSGYNCEKGTSLILVHNSRLKEIIDTLPISKIKVDFKQAIKGNSPVTKDVKAPLSRSTFFKNIESESLHDALYKAEKIHKRYWKYVYFIIRVKNRCKMIFKKR